MNTRQEIRISAFISWYLHLDVLSYLKWHLWYQTTQYLGEQKDWNREYLSKWKWIILSWSHQSIKLCSRTFVAHRCTSLLNLITPSYSDEWFASCGIASILLLYNSSNRWLWYLHPCPVEIVMSLTDILGVFFTALIMFLSSTAGIFLGWPFRCLLLSFFLFQDIPSFCTSCPQCLCNGSQFPLFSKPTLWSSCWFIFSNTDAVFTG